MHLRVECSCAPDHLCNAPDLQCTALDLCTVYISTLRVNLVCINVITRVNSLSQLFTSSNSRCLVGQLCVHDNGRPGAYSTTFYYG
jgi:hypothetical protein